MTNPSDVESLKGAFLAIISHELRTPLTEIIAACDALDGGFLGALNAGQKQYINVIQDAAQHLNSLISDLISFAQLQADQVELLTQPVELIELIQSTLDNYRAAAAAKHIEFLTLLAPGLPPLRLDANKISRVIANLVVNAINFTPEHGRVTVTLRAGLGSQCFDVSDTGRGIPVEKQDRIFESFYQAESHLTRQVGGLGIGLAYARRIVESHDGKLSFTSVPNRGSVFTVCLPAGH